MSEVLLLGMTHFPRLRLPDEQWNLLFLKMLSDPGVPAAMRDPAAWPEAMRKEWGNDRGLNSARMQRQALVADFRLMRKELEQFAPDFVVVWGDDQYENFRDDGIPAFAILAYESMHIQPWAVQPDGVPAPNVWNELPDATVVLKGHVKGANHLTSALLAEGFDITYAYKPRHLRLGHAFMNTAMYLDYDRTGFPWKLVPFTVNCYGRVVVSQRGRPHGLSEAPQENFDPPSPTPWRCFDLGRACARAAANSPWRIALIASSSWSHAFFTPKHWNLYPDVEADRRLFDDLVSGNYSSWRDRTLDEIEASGQQEVLNWMCLAGAFQELGRKPTYANFHESYVFNSPKVFVAGVA
jgi:hypothetical protein